ncbi:hypothetical protein CEXT_472591 [Caerostris extrusa]|uniref:Uncharacterized protein n=1 Tax=Caerostris extrusa TaxID=172846 RepID=A0AAV4T268_CAEEX|nr:hypothetical protein CEXT_472591 [Caerostris extrusa]
MECGDMSEIAVDHDSLLSEGSLLMFDYIACGGDVRAEKCKVQLPFTSLCTDNMTDFEEGGEKSNCIFDEKS